MSVDVRRLIEEAFFNQSMFGIKLGMFPEEVFSLFSEYNIKQGEGEDVYNIYFNDYTVIEIGTRYDNNTDNFMEINSIHVWLNWDYQALDKIYLFKDFLFYCASSDGLIVPVAIVDAYHWLYYYIGNDVSVDAEFNEDGMYYVSRIIMRSTNQYWGLSKQNKSSWDSFRNTFANKAILAKPGNAPDLDGR